ncbi:hypothetical protein [Paraburkholderia susongensis]|uniref:hypothetical protein n=1 Tax=Paraburkholderia susongensis TaxID=1515439 RepID=UPI0011803ACE|nr:hypothetical protein [Paraburkholderia susongensis]
MGYDKEIVERHLAHGSDEELGDAYGRAQFLDQRRRMSQAWADYLERLVSDENEDDLARLNMPAEETRLSKATQIPDVVQARLQLPVAENVFSRLAAPDLPR